MYPGNVLKVLNKELKSHPQNYVPTNQIRPRILTCQKERWVHRRSQTATLGQTPEACSGCLGLPAGPRNWRPSVEGSVAGSTCATFSSSWVSSGRCAWSWSCGWSCGWLWMTSPCMCTWLCDGCVGGGVTSSSTDMRCSMPWTIEKIYILVEKEILGSLRTLNFASEIPSECIT